jgi:hypothetical protein
MDYSAMIKIRLKIFEARGAPPNETAGTGTGIIVGGESR